MAKLSGNHAKTLGAAALRSDFRRARAQVHRVALRMMCKVNRWIEKQQCKGEKLSLTIHTIRVVGRA